MVLLTPPMTSDAMDCHFATKAVLIDRTSTHFSPIRCRPNVLPVLSYVTHLAACGQLAHLSPRFGTV
jgi:hypothetical protein